MANPFSESDTDILKEAFPLLEVSVIEDVLYTANGDMNEAFDMLLKLTDNTDKTNVPPQLPERRIDYTQPNPSLNPFLNNGNAKPLTVREELAQWRQDLRNESRRKMANKSSSTSLSSIRSHASTSSLSSYHSNSRANNFVRGSLQRPMMNNSRTYNTLRSTVSSPNVNYHNQSHSIQNGYSVPLHTSPPELPIRRQHTSLTTGDTNPFVTTTSQQNVRHSRTSLEAHAPTLNPFEAPDFPPPPYSEISADTIVHPQ